MMSNRRLGKCQQEVIDRLQAGEVLHWMTGLRPYAFWHETYETLDNRVLFSLENRGLVQRISNERNLWFVVLKKGEEESEVTP